jgi:hypothetical protein
MAVKEVIVNVCDVCDHAEPDVVVSAHRVVVDKTGVDIDTCDECWADVTPNLATIQKAGRRITAKVPKVTREVVEWPGSRWRFSAHALQRLGERHIDPLDAANVADDPAQTWPGIKPGLEVRSRGGVKVVVNPKSFTIATVSNRDEAEEAVA